MGVRSPVQARDDTRGHAVGQAKRIADGDDMRPHVGSTAESRGHESPRQRRRDERRDVLLRISGGDSCPRLGAVSERDADVLGTGDDMVRGQDRAIVGHDDAGPELAASANDDH
jgi:hypothetical protein